MKFLGRLLLGMVYAAVPIIGWGALYNSFKRIKAGEIAMIQNANGTAELIETGLYFRPFPGDKFGKTYQKTDKYIDFGPIQRVQVLQNEVAYKTKADGAVEGLAPGIHLINATANESFDPLTHIKNNQEDYIDQGARKIVRIRPGKLGVKIDARGNAVELAPGNHVIDSAAGEMFNPLTDIQDIGQDDFTLGNCRHITIRNGELGESYKDGIFVLLEPGRHKLPANHRFVKKVSVDNDIVDLGALKIVTVKEGQVAVINTTEGVTIKGPGKHEIKQSEGHYFNSILTTSPQAIVLPPLTVMCSDQIEMRAESMLTFKITDPLKTVGRGITNIVDMLKGIADGTLRNILSRFSSLDIAPSLHVDEDHHSTKRYDKLNELHDKCVDDLNGLVKEWGLEVCDLQITQVLPADHEFLATIRKSGAQQSTAEAERRLAESQSQIAIIKANGEVSRVKAAEIEQHEQVVRAETESRTKAIQADAAAKQIVTAAQAKAQATMVLAEAEAGRIHKLSEASKDAAPITQQIMLLEAQKEILAHVDRPIFVQPGLGDTSIITPDKKSGGMTFFSTKKSKANAVTPLVEALNLDYAAKRLGAVSSSS